MNMILKGPMVVLWNCHLLQISSMALVQEVKTQAASEKAFCVPH